MNVKYDLLHQAPEYAKACRITCVGVSLKYSSRIQLQNLLTPFEKLESITLHGLSKGHKGLLDVLEAKGKNLLVLHLIDVFEPIRFTDVSMACPNLLDLTLHFDASCAFGIMYQDMPENLLCGLHYLKNLSLKNVNKKLCSGDMMTALLVSTFLKTIHLTNVESLDDIVLDRVQCYDPGNGSSTLASVELESIYLKKCPSITAAPLCEMMKSENTILSNLHNENCDQVDMEVLQKVKFCFTLG